MTKKTYLPKGKKFKPIALLAAGLFWVGLAQAQESTNTSGGDATGNGGSIAYSIGKVVYTTHSGTGGSLAQGVQHTYEITSLGVDELAFGISLLAFPNPTEDNLTLKINNNKEVKLMYQLYDMLGKIVYNGEINEQQTQINMTHLPSAMYLLNVMTPQNNKVQSFKIVKK